MGVREWLSAKLVPPPTERQQAALAAAGDTIADEDRGWTPLGTTRNRRNLSPWKVAEAQELAHQVWQKNPLARRMVDLEVDIVCGEGFSVSSKDERADEVLQTHWNHPMNAWDEYMREYVREKTIWGEALMPISVGQGQVFLGWVDPSCIIDVKKCEDNAKWDGMVKVLSGKERLQLENIRYRLADDALMGDAFFFRRNSVIGATRGVSDLYPFIDWVMGHEQMLFDQMERVGLLNSFIWDVTLKGLDADQIQDRAKTMTTPDPGSLRMHNEGEVWQTLTPDIRASDASESANTVKKHIASGWGFPEHWVGAADDVNRSTASETDFPTTSTMASRSRSERTDTARVMAYILQVAHRAGRVDAGVTFKVDSPPVHNTDVEKVASAFQATIGALSVARTNSWTDDDTAIKILSMFAGKFGVDVDVSELKEMLNNPSAAEIELYKKSADQARNMERRSNGVAKRV